MNQAKHLHVPTVPLSVCRASVAAMLMLAMVFMIATRANAVICIVPDAGGTAQMPPQCFTGYLSPQQVHMIVNGLPPGTTILADATHRDFFNITGGPGGSLGGEFEQFNSGLQLQLQGTGSLAGFNRNIFLPTQCETHIGPRTPGNPVQSFPTDMFRLQGQIIGDPDFDLLRITGGTFFGMPSPGHTTLTRQPGGDWAVDSFFDVFYSIEFIGAPGGSLSGMSGSTTGTIRMGVGQADPPVFCRCKGDSNIDGVVDVPTDLPWFVAQLISDNGDLCADMDENLAVNGRDIQVFVDRVINSPTCLALDAWETPDPTGDPLTSSHYQFGVGDQPAIPGSFFDPGSDPFTGIVLWAPQPLDDLMGPTDTIVRRPPLPFVPPGPPVVVPIEMHALNLVSVQPIIVTYTSPPHTEQWHVSLAISDTAAPGGSMAVQRTGPNGGQFTATIAVRPVFVFTNINDLNDLEAGLISPDQVRVRVLDTGQPGSPINPLQLQFGEGPLQSDWASQVCGQPIADGLFFFNNAGMPFVPGINAPFNCADAFKPGPMKHVKPGESHYVKPPNKGNPVPGRCYYLHFASKAFCQPGKAGFCPPAPAVLCGRKCPPLPCPKWAIRLVKIPCQGPLPPLNPGWCVQFYRLRPPPFDCTVCP